MTVWFDSLQSAARLMVIQHGFNPSRIDYARLGATYRATPEQAREAIETAMGSSKLPEEIAVSAPSTQQPEDSE